MKRLVGLIALAAGAACAPPGSGTTLVVHLSSDLAVPQEIDQVELVVAGGELRYSFALGAGGGGLQLPVRVALVPKGARDRMFEVEAIATKAGAKVVSQAAAVAFVPGTAQELALFLGRSCVGTPACPADSTCQGGACVGKSAAGTRRVFGTDGGADTPETSPDAPRDATDARDTTNADASNADAANADTADAADVPSASDAGTDRMDATSLPETVPEAGPPDVSLDVASPDVPPDVASPDASPEAPPKKPVGTACDSAAECESSYCQQGVCCATACTGTCRSCAGTNAGVCSDIPAGQDPLNHCTDARATAADSCGTDGACDGAGACRLYASGAVCGSAATSCDGSTLSQPRRCDGTGTCQAAMTSSCGPYVCGSATACRTACAAQADCLALNVCTGSTCAPAPTVKAQYFALSSYRMATSQNVGISLRIVNLGTSALPLSEVTLRYWFTREGTTALNAVTDYASSPLSPSSVMLSFVTVAPLRINADTYLQIAFGGAVSLPAAGSADMQIRFNKTDFSNFNQANDYSWDGIRTAYADWDRVTIYRNGVRVWGVEP